MALPTLQVPTLIAPWWDDLSYSIGVFKYQVLGTAPQRMLVIEWGNVAYSTVSATRFSFQTILYESTNQIRFAYGPPARVGPGWDGTDPDRLLEDFSGRLDGLELRVGGRP